MKTYLGWIFALGFVALAGGMFWDSNANKNAPTPEAEMQKAPNFSLPDIHGKTIELDDYKGKIRIVDFWATWCPPCRAEIPHFNALSEKYPELVILGISLDKEGPGVVKDFAQEHNVKYPLLMGNIETVKAFGNIQSIPTTFLIDQNGTIVKKYVGYKPQEVFETDIQALLSPES